MGLTFLAWGNSIGDTVADVTLAKQGHARMAISACFGGPFFSILFNCIFKICLSLLWSIITTICNYKQGHIWRCLPRNLKNFSVCENAVCFWTKRKNSTSKVLLFWELTWTQLPWTFVRKSTVDVHLKWIFHFIKKWDYYVSNNARHAFKMSSENLGSGQLTCVYICKCFLNPPPQTL